MTEIAVSRGQSIAFWTIFATATAIAVATVAVLGPSVTLPADAGGDPVRTKSTWKLFIQPAAMALVWFAFRAGVGANLGAGCFGRLRFDAADADAARASETFARTLVNAALAYAVVLLVMQIVTVGRLAGLEPFTSLEGPIVLRFFFAAAGGIEIFMGNVWPKSALAASREGEAAHVHRMRRFRGWLMTLNGAIGIVCALTLPAMLILPTFLALWLTKVVALNLVNALDDRPRPDAAGPR